MRITENLDVTYRNNGELVVTEVSIGRFVLLPSDTAFNPIKEVYDTIRNNMGCDRESVYNANRKVFDDFFAVICGNGAVDENGVAVIDPNTLLERGLKNLMNFFTEFSFAPNFRFVNTFALCLAKSPKDAVDYVHNYFRLIDSPYAVEVKAKMKSDEFKNIMKDISAVAPTATINNRFKVYYGDAGTGKTTIAQSECENRCVVCNNAMLPSDLMEDFIFDNGKPSFKPSVLWECMEQGKPIVLDEMNLLPFDSLRFLQGILDNKKEFVYKGHTVTIADGFSIIATMNLVVNGAVFNLPEPLVDRSAEIKEFKLTAKQLMKAIV